MTYPIRWKDDSFGCLVAITLGITAIFILCVAITRMNMTCDIEFTDGRVVHSEHYCTTKKTFAYCGSDVYSNFKHIRCK